MKFITISVSNKEMIFVRRFFIVLAAVFAIFTTTASAERTGTKYLKHITGWYGVDSEKIYTPSDKLTFYLDSGDFTAQLGAEAMPINTTDKKLTYSSSDESIVTVDENGTVTSKNKGGAASVTVNCGDVSAEVTVEVVRGVTGISLSHTDLTFYADRPQSASLKATVYPSDATNKNVKWTSSDTAVAAVDENGTITPSGVGTATVSAVTEDGGFKAECTVRVTIYNVPVRAVFIENAVEAIRIGGEYRLTAYIYPQNARNKYVGWSSDNTSVAEVDGNGNLMGISEGNALIRAVSANGAEDTFTVNVVPDDGTPFEYRIISRPVSERIAELSVPAVYTNYKITLAEAVKKQLAQNPVTFSNKASPASSAEVEKYINPANYASGSAKYQFALLNGTNGLSVETLNTYLSNKGVLKGKGSVFIDASKKYGVSEIYLAVHAVLESGSGTSRLACGIDYNGTTVYNMFGIGAYDKDPENEGAKYAYEHGWTSVDSAIYGGAKWISENYINGSSKQNTLYKMRWNPSNPGVHQYATDVAWAVKQAGTLYSLFGALPEANVNFDVPVYKGENECIISYE